MIKFKFEHGRKSPVSPDAPSVKAFSWILENLQLGKAETQVVFRHSRRCGACGRKLTTPESIDSGIGPVCDSKPEFDRIRNKDGNIKGFHALEFMLAGKATITATSKVSGKSYTFKIRKADAKPGASRVPYFVKVLTGPDNANSYTYLGCIWPVEPAPQPSLPLGPEAA